MNPCFSLLAATLCLFSFTATAATPPPSAGEVLAAATFDWDGDGQLDTFRILAPVAGNEMDRLVIRMGDGKSFSNESLLPNNIVNGANAAPKLVLNSDGSLKIESVTETYSSSLNVSYLGSLFILTGLSYSQHYQGLTGSCEVNFVTGEATANGNAVKTEKHNVVLARSPRGGITQGVVAVCLDLMDRNPQK